MISRRKILPFLAAPWIIRPACASTRLEVLFGKPKALPPPFLSSASAYYRMDRQGSLVLSGNNVTQVNDLGPAKNNASVVGTLAYNSNAGDTTGLKGSVRFSGAGEYVDLPAGLSVDRQSSSIFIWYKKTDNTAASFNSLFHLTSAADQHALNLDNATPQTQLLNIAGASTDTGFGASYSFCCSDLIGGAANAFSGIGADLYTKGSAFTAGSFTTGRIGLWTGASFPLFADVQCVLFYNIALTLAQRAQVLAWGQGQFSTVSSACKLFIINPSDSRGYGTGSTDPFNYSFPLQLSRLYQAPPKIYQAGVPGATIAGNTAQTANIGILNSNLNYANRVAIFSYIINDITAGQTDVQIEANLTTAFSNIRAGSPGCKVVALTAPPKTGLSGGQITFLNSTNAWLISSSSADIVVNVAGDPRFADPSNTTYFNADGLHFTNLGYAVIASLIQTALNAAGLTP